MANICGICRNKTTQTHTHRHVFPTPNIALCGCTTIVGPGASFWEFERQDVEGERSSYVYPSIAIILYHGERVGRLENAMLTSGVSHAQITQMLRSRMRSISRITCRSKRRGRATGSRSWLVIVRKLYVPRLTPRYTCGLFVHVLLFVLTSFRYKRTVMRLETIRKQA